MQKRILGHRPYQSFDRASIFEQYQCRNALDVVLSGGSRILIYVDFYHFDLSCFIPRHLL